MASIKNALGMKRVGADDTTVSPSITDIAGLMAADPYKNQQVETTVWDLLGISNQADARQAELNQLSAEYQAGMAEKAYDNWYNSPLEASRRLRMAGFNPDLAGLDNAGTSSGSNPNHAGSTALSPVNEGLTNFAKGIVGIVGLASNLTQTFMQTHKMGLENDILSADLLSKGTAYGKQWILDNWTPDFWTDTDHASRSLSGGRKRLSNAIFAGIDSLYTGYGDNKTASPELRKHYFGNRYGAADASFKAASLEGSKYYSGEFETMKALSGILTDMQLDATKNKNAFDSKYHQTANPSLKAGMDNATWQNIGSEQQFQYDFDATRRKMVRKLQALSDSGNMSATIALLFMNTALPAIGGVVGSKLTPTKALVGQM